jgi:hypothetical protein
LVFERLFEIAVAVAQFPRVAAQTTSRRCGHTSSVMIRPLAAMCHNRAIPALVPEPACQSGP